MSARGDFVTPRFDGVRSFDTPPLLYWLLSTAFALGGPAAAAARYWPALSGVAVATLTAATGVLIGGARVGLLAGLMVAANLGIFLHARLVEPDVLFIAFVTLAYAGFAAAYLGRGGRRGLAIFYAGLALAAITKDVVLAVGAVVAVGVFLFITRECPLGPWVPWWGIAVLAALPVAWYFAVERRNHGFVWYTVVDGHVLRYLHDRHFPDGHASVPTLDFLVATVVAFLPLSLAAPWAIDPSRRRVVVVMPAYNAGRTLRMTYEELPKDTVSTVILVDDGSTDATLEVARQLGLQVFVHNRNYGYGANQKTCYTEALRAGADIVVMVHPDYQYDPRLVPQIIEPIVEGQADVVLGSRLKSGSPIAQGMPWWKYVANRVLTGVENRVFGLALSEYHTGYRAFRREVLEGVNFLLDSDSFIFDQEIIGQAVSAGFRISEIAVPTRYFPEASSASFSASTVYGIKIITMLFWFSLHRMGLRRSRRFDRLRARYPN